MRNGKLGGRDGDLPVTFKVSEEMREGIARAARKTTVSTWLRAVVARALKREARR